MIISEWPLTWQYPLASREAGAETTATVEEGMSNFLAVQSLGAHDRQPDEFDRDGKESFSKYRSYVWMNGLLVGLRATIAWGLLIYVFFDIAEAIIAGQMTPGDSGILWTYFGQLLLTTVALGALWFKLQDNLVGMRRVFQIIDQQTDHERHGHETLETVRDGLSIDHVSYTYPDGTLALSDINLEARVGEMVALVGATGSGKTTLSYLIPAFIQPTEGRVLFDGIDTRTLTVDNLRDLVSFVFRNRRFLMIRLRTTYGSVTQMPVTQSWNPPRQRLAHCHSFAISPEGSTLASGATETPCRSGKNNG